MHKKWSLKLLNMTKLINAREKSLTKYLVMV